jgi:hypothetical protein
LLPPVLLIKANSFNPLARISNLVVYRDFGDIAHTSQSLCGIQTNERDWLLQCWD